MKKRYIILSSVLAMGLVLNTVGLTACAAPEEVVPIITERVRYSDVTNPYAEVTWQQIGSLEDWAHKTENGAKIYYQFEGDYAEGWQGNYDRDYLFMDCYEDGSLYGTCQNQTYIGWWYNVTHDGREGLVLNILTQNGNEYNSGNYGVSLQQLGSGGYYEFTGNVVGSQNGRLMPINGFHYSPIKTISVDASGAKTKYVVGDDFSSSGLSISITRENGKSTVIDAQSYASRVSNKRVTFSGFSSKEAGNKAITVNYLNETATGTFNVDVYKVKSIEAVLGEEAQQTYYVGQKFSEADIKIMATAEGTTEKIELTKDYKFSGYEPETSGQQTITVTYNNGEEELTTSFNVTSVAMKENGLTLTTDEVKKDYYVGEDFDSTGLVIEAEYEDGEFIEFDVVDCDVKGFNSSKVAQNQTITVSLGGQSATFNVNIKAAVYTGQGKYSETTGEVKLLITSTTECEVTFNNKTATVKYSAMNVAGMTIYSLMNDGTPSGLSEEEWNGLHKQYSVDKEEMTLTMCLVYEIPDDGYSKGTSRFEYEPFVPQISGYCEQRYLIFDEEAQKVTLTYKYFNGAFSDTWVMKYERDQENPNKITFTEVVSSQVAASGKTFEQMRKSWILRDNFTAYPADVTPVD